MKLKTILFITICIIICFFLIKTCTNSTSTQKSPSTTKEIVLNKDNQMVVHFIDVGQGDSIFVEFPNGKNLLVDGGTKSAGKQVVSYLRSINIKQLQTVVATHPDADHIGGLIPIINSFKIQQFVDSGKVHTSQTYEEMLQLIADKNISYKVPQTGELITIDPSVEIEILHADENASDNNDASIILRISHENISFLLMADASISLETEIMQKSNVSATVLKAGHHGSNTSSSLPFLKKVKPEVTILSYGNNNNYGHPHAEVIGNLRTVKSKIYGTAESGTIIVYTDGQSYVIDQPEWTGVGATSSITWQNTPNTSEKRGVYLAEKNLADEYVVITNNSSNSISLAGWTLVSVEGNQQFEFPDIIIEANSSIQVTSGPDAQDSAGYLKWSSRQIWSNSGDKAILYNKKGEVVDELD